MAIIRTPWWVAQWLRVGAERLPVGATYLSGELAVVQCQEGAAVRAFWPKVWRRAATPARHRWMTT